eukprot:Sdes_comp20371_c0_seq1m14204
MLPANLPQMYNPQLQPPATAARLRPSRGGGERGIVGFRIRVVGKRLGAIHSLSESLCENGSRKRLIKSGQSEKKVNPHAQRISQLVQELNGYENKKDGIDSFTIRKSGRSHCEQENCQKIQSKKSASSCNKQLISKLISLINISYKCECD